jgi:hypothetical protein
MSTKRQRDKERIIDEFEYALYVLSLMESVPEITLQRAAITIQRLINAKELR